jgi:hypothetical protein
MQFKLKNSPFRSLPQLSNDQVMPALFRAMREYVSQSHSANSQPIPPSVFVLRGADGLFLNGFKYPSIRDFVKDVRRLAEKATAVVIAAEIGGLGADFTNPLLLLEYQTAGFRARKAYRLETGEIFEIDDRWMIPNPQSPDGLLRIVGVKDLFEDYLSNPHDGSPGA